jgi:tripartite-type tricarboxylate transporter receptor subunit TctC
MASAGIGSSSQFAGKLFKDMAGIDMTHIPCRRGGPAIVNLLGDQVDVFFSPMAIAAHVRAGKLRALASTGTARSDALPEIPTVSEFVPGYETSYWIGLGTPKSTPVEIIGKLNNEIDTALAGPGLKSRFADLDGSVVGGTANGFAKLVSDETHKWGRVVRAAHIKAE